MSKSSGNGSEINKGELFGEWMRGEKWQRNLKKSVAHKALDIAEAEDVNLSVNKSTGIGNAGLIGAVAAAGLGPAMIGLALLFKGGTAPPPVTSPGPADSAYRVLFYGKNGELIDVPHIKDRPKTLPKE